MTLIESFVGVSASSICASCLIVSVIFIGELGGISELGTIICPLSSTMGGGTIASYEIKIEERIHTGPPWRGGGIEN